MSTRRKILLSVGASAVAGVIGCTSTLSSPDTSPPNANECPDEPQVPAVEGGTTEQEAPEIPSSADSLTEDDVVKYVETYEYAYAWRRNTRRGVLREFHLDRTADPVWSGEDGVFCEFDTLAAHGRYEADDGEEYYFDLAPYAASYLVTDDAVWRAETDRADRPPEPPDPKEDGKILECF